MSEKLDRLYEFAKNLGFTERGPLWETTPSVEVMPDFRIFPNTVRDIKEEVDARIAELTAEVARLRQAHEYIAKSWPDSFAARESRSVIARNALKEGM